MTDRTPLPTTDTAAKIADTTINEIVSVELPVVETAIETAEPFLAWPVVKQFWEAVFSWLSKQIGNALGTFTGYIVVDAQKYFALQKAASAAAALVTAKQTGDVNAIETASQNVDAAVAPILHYVGDNGNG
jgi:hypothetical protein